MKGAVRLSLVLSVLLPFSTGCDESSSPTAANMPGWVYGAVLSSEGACLNEATVEVLDGPRAGFRTGQSCGNIEDTHVAFVIRGLTFREAARVTIRASAPGYASETASCLIEHDGGFVAGNRIVTITLSRSP